MRTREHAQLEGLIPTTPEGAVRDERVDPRTQGSAILPDLVRQALRESWATPDIAKPAIVASMLEPFFEERQEGEPPDRKTLIECAKVLRALDQTQHERDNPSEVGGGVHVTVQATQVMRDSLEDVDAIMALTKQVFRQPAELEG